MGSETSYKKQLFLRTKKLQFKMESKMRGFAQERTADAVLRCMCRDILYLLDSKEALF